jgi:GDPmannose 4,6-dehydratase
LSALKGAYAKALITGITGQDGSYLAEFPSAKGYEIHGLKRRSSSLNTERVDHLYVDFHQSGAKFFLHYADLSEANSLAACLNEIRPDEIYNLGAQSHVKVSFDIPE